jgi:hypothetical protein
MTRTLARVLLGPEPGQTGTARSQSDGTQAESAIVLIAGVSFVAGLIHVAASIDHAREFLLYTLVFAMLAAFQIAWAIAVTRRCSRPVLIGAVAFNLAIIGLWVASRTVGVPIAPHPWVPEAVGAADVLATVAEIVIVIGAASVLMSPRSPFAQRALARLVPLSLAVILLCVMFGISGGHAG